MQKKVIIFFIIFGFLSSGAPALEVGEPAPCFRMEDRNGKQIELAGYQGRKNVLLVFSRYIGCSWCQMFIIDLHKHRDQIMDTGAEVIIISNSAKDVIKGYNPPEDFAFTLVPDRDMKLYELYGVRMENRDMTGNVWLQSLRFLRYLGDYDWVKDGLEGDHYQPPVCMIVGKDGKIKYKHVGRDVADNPRVDDIIQELTKLK